MQTFIVAGTPNSNLEPLRSPPEKAPRNRESVPSAEADDINALFLAMTHDGVLLLAAVQTPLLSYFA